MLHHPLRWTVAVALAAGLGSWARAQDQKPPAKPNPAEQAYQATQTRRLEEEYKQFYKRPETPEEYWAALNFEIDVGRFGLAGQLLRGLLASTKDNDQALLAIEERDGLEAFLRLRTIPSWVDDPYLPQPVKDKINREAKANVEELITRVSRALKAHLADPVRFRRLIANLTGTPDEQRYALGELQRSGALSVPSLLAAVQSATDPDLRRQYLSTIIQLPRAATAPLEAALDTPDENLKLELIDLLEKRVAKDAIPFLWFPSASPRESELVRAKAREGLAYLLQVAPDRLTPARVALTREAERYYQHQVAFPTGQDVTVWQWDQARNQPDARTMTASAAEEYYALRFARQALDLDPAYEPAQVVFLSTALEKGSERAGIDQPLGKGAPEVQQLLKVVNPELVIKVLQRALADHRQSVILGAVRALGDMAEVRAARPTSLGPPVLVQALDYPDRRVQMAAADALHSIPGPPPAGAGPRVVEVLRRNLAADPAPTALVADPNPDRAERVALAVQKAGFATTIAHTGREVMTRLARAADVDVLLIDHDIPDSRLPYLLSQLRADMDDGLLPILVTVPPELSPTVETLPAQDFRREVARYPNVWVFPRTLDSDLLRSTLTAKITAAMGKPLSAEERQDLRAEALRWLERMATGERTGYDVRPAAPAILKAADDNALAQLAIEALGRMPGTEPQIKLATVVLDGARPVELRSAAAVALAEHIQIFGRLLSQGQVQGLLNLFNMAGLDPKLRSNAARLVGELRPSALQTGQRLEGFFPPAPATPAPPAPPAEPGKEK